MNVLFWISQMVETAVLRGFANAVAKLELAQDDDSPLAAITARMTPTPTNDDQAIEAKPARKNR